METRLSQLIIIIMEILTMYYNMMKMEKRLSQLIMMNQEMLWNKVFMKKLKKAKILTIQHMMHKEMLKTMENMKI